MKDLAPQNSLLLAGQREWEYYGFGEGTGCVFSATQLAGSFPDGQVNRKGRY